MWLDADDVLLEDDQNELRKLKATLSLIHLLFMMRYNTNFNENGQPTFTYYRERLLRRIDCFSMGWILFMRLSVPWKNCI